MAQNVVSEDDTEKHPLIKNKNKKTREGYCFCADIKAISTY